MAESPFKRFGLPAGPASGNVGRSRLLERLARMRAGTEPTPANLEFGACLLSIPELDYAIIRARFPDLDAPDAEIKRRAWIKFSNSEEGAKYRTASKRWRT